ncbi:MAG: thiamine pyrophosphate-dependent enzyme [Bacteroidales bacterium]|jgi:pyruvate/2-oxoacid:ferredoxin oxidoreductase beta subunit|nr:thiamine pyrophosphate-dependent enzyme [Bacteroidales bacterium]
MNNIPFLNSSELPFCKGCGHATVAQNTEKALQKLGIDPLDVVMTTDIGCHGIIDKNLLTHTVHGLHGRSVALASGITAGINDPSKKVIVFIGDGGSTIGLQHLIGSAHNGFDLTVVIHNNMLYGMTGGQPSEFTPCGFKTTTLKEGSTKEGYDICELIAAAGASYVRRVLGIGDYSDALVEAINTKGFSLVEVMEICPSYGMKANPGMKLSKVVEDAGLPVKEYTVKDKKTFHKPVQTDTKSLISDKLNIEVNYEHSMKSPVRILTAGSASEGTQSAAEFLASAAMKAGLHVTKKGNYPVTVGVGFSASEVIISPKEIFYSGFSVPDVAIITSQDGLEYSLATLKKMTEGLILIDESLATPETKAKVIRVPFREKVGARNSSMFSIFWYLNHSNIFPLDALKDVFMNNKISEKVKIESLLQF